MTLKIDTAGVGGFLLEVTGTASRWDLTIDRVRPLGILPVFTWSSLTRLLPVEFQWSVASMERISTPPKPPESRLLIFERRSEHDQVDVIACIVSICCRVIAGRFILEPACGILKLGRPEL